MAQLDEVDLSRPGPNSGNSIAVIVWHLAGNLASRFTDFLTTDGEKAWRHRDKEFDQRTVTRPDLLSKWASGWDGLFKTLTTLRDADLAREVTIRAQSLKVEAALYQSLAHTSHHVGQIVYLAKSVRGPAWTSLSIPLGQSEAYNRNPAADKSASHADTVSRTETG